MGYTKLDANLVTSSIWSEDDKTLRVWVYLMARAGANGSVLDTIPAIARACGYDNATVDAILKKLAAPDEYSRTPDMEGRRICITTVPEFSINLVNHSKYRHKDHTHAARQKKYRDGKRDARDASLPSRVTPSDTSIRQKTKAEVSTETELRLTPPASTTKAPPKDRPSWLDPAIESWKFAFKGRPDEKALKQHIGYLVREFGWDSVRPVWSDACCYAASSGEAKFFTPKSFAAKFGAHQAESQKRQPQPPPGPSGPQPRREQPWEKVIREGGGLRPDLVRAK